LTGVPGRMVLPQGGCGLASAAAAVFPGAWCPAD
jgi:hypothetical protein